MTVISAFVFAGVLSAYIFLGRALTRQGNAEQLESRGRLALYDFTQDMSGSSAVTSASSSQITVSTWIQQASGTPVLATAQYTYSSVNAQLTLVRTSPVSPSLLAFPGWPTSNTVLLNNLTSFNFGTYDISGVATTVASQIKQVNMTFTTTAGLMVSGAQSHYAMVSPRIILKNKPSLQ